ncbi:GntR family transcriptional regulator [Paraburkholderia lycopersici]|uniref:DNA-binding transcriptional regulator, GntR family n=1 Tax=Paraburkholderia lycopersici TaxID=416944 RepID=A0A1G6J2U0_9BURK|nr:GntR family transcriptional regulator [Paraburkholderia lycopersici]SDC12645.1 DNA-binding transcriptional regulator, GntR family [Paraburkholderia lycopersici]
MKTRAHQSLQDETYATLRRWLSLGRFVPGERLRIHALAGKLGVGEMPVRAALVRLAAESALVNLPNRGVMVPQLTRAQFDDVLDVRVMLEGKAASLAAARLTAAEIARLDALCAQMAEALAQNKRARYLDVNEDFHLALYRASGSPLLVDLIETVWLQVGPISNLLFEDTALAHTLNEAHESLMRRLKRRDAEGARRAIERDLRHAAKQLRAHCLPDDAHAADTA